MAVHNPDLRKALSARRSQMDEDFNRWKPLFMELRNNIQPTTARFEGEGRRETGSYLKKIVDPKARRGLQTLSAGLMAGMTSPSRPWFRLGLTDPDLKRAKPVAEWLHTTEQRMYDVLRGSNVYRLLESSYRALGTYGTFGGVLVPNFENVVHGHAFAMGQYRIAEDEFGRAAYLHRDCEITVINLVKSFGLKNCSQAVKNAYAQSRYHEYIQCCHAIEPRKDRDTSSIDNRNKPYGSYYWEKGEDGFLDIGGFSIANILAPRWEQTEGEVWSTSSPGMNALGDQVQLQGQHRDKAIAIKKMADPPLQGAGTRAATHVRNIPGGVSTIDTNDLQKGGLRPIYEVRPDVQWLVHDINETRRRIDEAFFVDLFLMTAQSDRRQVTAREIAERHEEKLLVLGPVLESLDHALLSPLIEATFHFMQEAGIVPPAPEELAQNPIQVEYISALAQAQKAVGVAPIERTIGFIGAMEEIWPGTSDNLDADETAREFISQVGPPPNIMRDPKDVAADREARAQQQQAQQALEAAQPLASTAKLLSEASERGAEGLQQQAPL